MRALLIQKDVKRDTMEEAEEDGLRALLIQKDVKPFPEVCYIILCLRALLIQKDVKLKTVRVRYTAV